MTLEEEQQSLIKEYFRSGKPIFKITVITCYRDGGTGVIETDTGGTFIIHQKTGQILIGSKSGEPLNDKPTEAYLLERLHSHLDREQARIDHSKHIVSKINSQFN